jgi:hypothetical protein
MTMTLNNNQELYVTTNDQLRNSHGQGVTAHAILVTKSPVQKKLNRDDGLQHQEKISYTQLVFIYCEIILSKLKKSKRISLRRDLNPILVGLLIPSTRPCV